MGLKAQIAAGVMRAFIAIGDVAKNLTYVKVSGEGVRDIETGETVFTETRFPVPMAVFVRMKTDELGDDIAAQQDSKLIFPLIYVGGDSYEFAEADYIIDRVGRQWEIKRYMGEPSQSCFIAQVRD